MSGTASSNPVTQPWVAELPLMMQGTLMTCTRGLDSAPAPAVKAVVRWLRGLILINGNPENDFMDVPPLPQPGPFLEELQYAPWHYVAHLMHSLQIVGYRHPDVGIRQRGAGYYGSIVQDMHLHPEGQSTMEVRLSGKPGTTADL